MSKKKAFVLILVEMGQVPDVFTVLRTSPLISDAEVITGPYDIIATLYGADMDNVANIVVDHIHTIQGVNHTVTLMSVNTQLMSL